MISRVGSDSLAWGNNYDSNVGEVLLFHVCVRVALRILLRHIETATMPYLGVEFSQGILYTRSRGMRCRYQFLRERPTS